jgi:hypothetical protein
MIQVTDARIGTFAAKLDFLVMWRALAHTELQAQRQPTLGARSK